MNLEFFDGTPVAVAKGLLSDEECIFLHNYAVETKLAETEESRAKMAEDSQYGESAFIQLDANLNRDVNKLASFWGSKNVHTKLGPIEVQNLIKKLHSNILPVLSEYLKQIDNPKKYIDPGSITFDPIHVYSAGHSFNNHVDCHEFALVFYVSDPSEFVGGDLVYDAGPRVTPTRGTLVIAPSNMPHEVLEVTDGFRCSLTNFFSAVDEEWVDARTRG